MRNTKRPTYAAAVRWIAFEDNPGDTGVSCACADHTPDPSAVRQSLTDSMMVAMVADLYDTSVNTVADSVMNVRRKHAIGPYGPCRPGAR